MRASEKLSARNDAFNHLSDVDNRLRAVFGEGPSLRTAGAARKLLTERAKWADRFSELGGQPGPAPVDIQRAEAV